MNNAYGPHSDPPTAQSPIGALYQRTYERIAGRAPLVYPWHHQWLATHYVRRDLQRVLEDCRGRLLDVGCGAKPYGRFLPNIEEHVGIDLVAGPEVDHVVAPAEPWPLADAVFDTVLCTQVLEHVEDVGHVLAESRRVLRAGGLLVCTVPFLYNEHGSPFDFRRFSARADGVFRDAGFDVVSVHRQGAVGSTVVVLTLNWIEASLNGGRVRRMLKGVLLPLWLLWSLLLNVIGRIWDLADRTGLFYGNVLFVVQRR